MKFGKLQKVHFKATEGAYSIVTDRERVDGQITITERDGESGIVLSALNAARIPRGAAQGNRQNLTIIQRDGIEKSGNLTINFPKDSGNELRIYRSEDNGFDFNAGDVWYVFRRRTNLFVGCVAETQWRGIGTTDLYDDEFQDIVDSKQSISPCQVEIFVKKFLRNPNHSRAALERSHYRCEYSGEPTPFISKRTAMPYLEAHHLIPFGLQPEFEFNLDTPKNIVALNPLWHRAIHHAEPQTVRKILEILAKKRTEFLLNNGVSASDLAHLYGCEEIKQD